MASFKPHSHLPYGEDGTGVYGKFMKSNHTLVKLATPMVLNALESIRFKRSEKAFTICDYGTADGATTMFLMRDAIRCLKSRYGDDQPVHVIYEDQPVNDFKSLFLRIHGMEPEPPSYLKDFQEVYVSACGTNFYDQCLPSGSVNLAVSFIAMHWLSERPCNLSDSFVHLLSSIPEEKEKFKEQAAKDWETILLQRAKELAQGGQMVLVNLCVDRKGHYYSKSGREKISDYEALQMLLKEMVTDGLITEEEFQNTTNNVYLRSEADFRAPFDDVNSRVTKAGLKLIAIESKVAECAYYEEWKTPGKKVDRQMVKDFVTVSRIWGNSTFMAGLSDKRTEQEKVAIVDELFWRYENLVAAKPQDFCKDYVGMYVQIEKM